MASISYSGDVDFSGEVEVELQHVIEFIDDDADEGDIEEIQGAINDWCGFRYSQPNTIVVESLADNRKYEILKALFDKYSESQLEEIAKKYL